MLSVSSAMGPIASPPQPSIVVEPEVSEPSCSSSNANRADQRLKEGVLEHETNGMVVMWKRKFCVLTREMLVIYRSESRKGLDADSDKNATYRTITLEDITSISNIEKGKSHIHFTICSKDDDTGLDLRVGMNQRDWLTQIQLAVSDRRNRNTFMNELKRKTSQVTHKYRKHGCKRLSFQKDPEYGDGIGITIRNVDDVIIVARLFDDGPAYKKGSLRVGDQIVEVNGQQVGGKHAESVASIIKAVPDNVVMFIKPCSVDRNKENLSPTPLQIPVTDVVPLNPSMTQQAIKQLPKVEIDTGNKILDRGTNTSAADFAMNRHWTMDSGLNERNNMQNVLSVEAPRVRPRSMGDILDDLDDDVGAVPIYSLRDARKMKSRKDSQNKRGKHKSDKSSKEIKKQNRRSLPMY